MRFSSPPISRRECRGRTSTTTARSRSTMPTCSCGRTRAGATRREAQRRVPRAGNNANRLARMPRRYDMLAVDLDGTLVNPRGEVSPADAAAIRAARDAGMTIAVCTGRGLAECFHFMEGIGQVEPVAVAGGSIIACPVQRRTIHRFALEPDLVARAVERLLTHNHPV